MQKLLCEGDPQHPLRHRAPQWARLALDADSVTDALNAVLVSAPHVYALNYDRLRSNMTAIIGRCTKSRFALEDFNVDALPLDLPAVLEGNSGTGKTQFALAHFNRALLLKHVEDLRSISPRTDGLVFDDVSDYSWPATEAISLLSTDIDRTLAARYSDIELPSNLPMIFTTNVVAQLSRQVAIATKTSPLRGVIALFTCSRASLLINCC